ncbi:hypothetical protein [Pseudomonas antarctica]|uniref:hypothetical protein n=1 Tax=Pseudomonas antarctica TaxID=219572 RepID=UPI003F750612
MTSAFNSIQQKVDDIKNAIQILEESLNGLSHDINKKSSTLSILQQIDIFESLLHNKEVDKLPLAAKHINDLAITLNEKIQTTKNLNPQSISRINRLRKKTLLLLNYTKNNSLYTASTTATPEEFKIIEPPSHTTLENNEITLLRTNLKALENERTLQDQVVKKQLSENEFRLSGINDQLSKLEKQAEGEIKKITLAYTAARKDIEEKNSQINDILGVVSGRAVAGDFEKSATEERAAADYLRIGSISCMILIIIILSVSVWETTKTTFNWEASIFRIIIAFLLSVPAAYLARESAKHREQQYNHQQTALDLKAISPYIASLPEEEQHKLKINIATRIFSARDFSKVGNDPYPLNSQEIIIELLKKLDIKPSNPNQPN